MERDFPKGKHVATRCFILRLVLGTSNLGMGRPRRVALGGYVYHVLNRASVIQWKYRTPSITTTGHPGKSGAIPVIIAVPDDVPPELLSRAVKYCYDNSKGSLSTPDNDPFKVGARGRQLNFYDAVRRPSNCTFDALSSSSFKAPHPTLERMAG